MEGYPGNETVSDLNTWCCFLKAPAQKQLSRSTKCAHSCCGLLSSSSFKRHLVLMEANSPLNASQSAKCHHNFALPSAAASTTWGDCSPIWSWDILTNDKSSLKKENQ
ncbi:uncharacterized protein LOC144132719 [Amblyomma americanum]